jgi:hypothetical protein
MIKLYHTLIVAGGSVYYLVIRTVRGLVKGLSRILTGGVVGGGRAFIDEIEKASTDVDALFEEIEAAEAEGRIWPVRDNVLL